MKKRIQITETLQTLLYIFDSQYLKSLVETVKGNDISNDLIPNILQRIQTVEYSGFYLDIGTHDDLERAYKFIESERVLVESSKSEVDLFCKAYINKISGIFALDK